MGVQRQNFQNSSGRPKYLKYCMLSPPIFILSHENWVCILCISKKNHQFSLVFAKYLWSWTLDPIPYENTSLKVSTLDAGPYHSETQVPSYGELSFKGGPLGHENVGFSRLPTCQGTPKKWVRSKIHRRTRDMARSPKLFFFFFFFS